MPFNFGEEELNFDESVSITCSITKGDTPLDIWWTFVSDTDSLPNNLTSNDGVVISRSTQKTSMLAYRSMVNNDLLYSQKYLLRILQS
jgi:hypothetical protein